MEKLNKVYIKDPESGRSGYFDLSLTNFDERYLNLSSLDAQKVNSDIVLGKGKSLSAESDHEHNHSLIKHTTGSGDIVTLDQVQVGDNIEGKKITFDDSYNPYPLGSTNKTFTFADSSILHIGAHPNGIKDFYYKSSAGDITKIFNDGADYGYLMTEFTLPNNIGVIINIAKYDEERINLWLEHMSVEINSLHSIEVGNTFDHLNLISLDRPTVTTPDGSELMAYLSDVENYELVQGTPTSTSSGLRCSFDDLSLVLFPTGTASTSTNILNLDNTGSTSRFISYEFTQIYSSGTREEKSSANTVASGGFISIDNDIATSSQYSMIKMNIVDHTTQRGYDVLMSVPCGWIFNKKVGSIYIKRIF